MQNVTDKKTCCSLLDLLEKSYEENKKMHTLINEMQKRHIDLIIKFAEQHKEIIRLHEIANAKCHQ